MNNRIDQLVKSLLQKDSLDQCSLAELQQFADRHPYFGAAQLLLSKKLQDGDPELYQDQLQKTLVFFHNPLWVENMLNGTGSVTIIKNKKDSEPEPVRPENLPDAEQTSIPGDTDGFKNGNEGIGRSQIQEIPPVSEDLAVPEETSIGPEKVIPAAPPETVTIIPEKENIGVAEATDNQPAVADEAVEKETALQAIPETPVMETTEIPQPELMNPALTEPEKPAGEELLFEPFYTVDYFASQGIRFREEIKPGDKFGVQLKSFTEWLKLMKKIPVAELSRSADPAVEKKVEEMAEISIRDREVLTESMAEVWEKQGNRARAIEIYGKLSLLEPSKSTYFAAKIEALKK